MRDVRDRRSRRGPLALALVAGLLVAAAAADELGDGGEAGPGAEPTPLQRRAQELIDAWQTAQADTALRTRLLAIADTLEAAGDLDLQVHVLSRAGIVSYYRGEIEDAQSIWVRTLVAARASGSKERISEALNCCAVGVSASGDYAEAIRLFRDLTTVRHELGDARGEAIAWDNLARTYSRLSLLAEAIDALRRSMPLHREAGNRHGIISAFLQRATAVEQLGQAGEAVALADSALAHAQGEDVLFLRGVAFERKASFLDGAGHAEAASALFDSSLAVLEPMGMDKAVNGVRLSRAESLVRNGDAVRGGTLVRRILPALEAEGEEVDLLRAATVLGASLVAAGDALAAETALRDAIRDAEALRDEQDPDLRAGALRAGIGAYVELARLLVREERVPEAWTVTERAAATLLRRRLQALPGDGAGTDADAVVPLGELQRQLAAIDGALLQCSAVAFSFAVVFVVSADGVRAAEIPVRADFLDDLRSATYLMSSGAADDLCLPPLRRLGATVLPAIEPRLPSGARRLTVVLGGFPGLPVEELSLETGGTLGDRFPVTYAPSASVFHALRSRAASQSGMVVFADPVTRVGDTDDVLSDRMRSLAGVALPQARAEAGDVAVRGARVLTGKRAAKPELLATDAAGASILHFATHAMIDPLSGPQCALLLSGTGPGEALLTADEVEDAHLRAELVSLSGCRTAGGYTHVGEGTYGLSRSFLVAGARSVVSSRWDVEDGAAREFMAAFYGALRRGVERDVAVRSARRTMRDAGSTYRDRAAFLLTGVGAEPVAALTADRAGRTWIVPAGVLLAAVAAGAVYLRRRRA